MVVVRECHPQSQLDLASRTKAGGVEIPLDAEVVLETRVDAEVGWRVLVITEKPPIGSDHSWSLKLSTQLAWLKC